MSTHGTIDAYVTRQWVNETVRELGLDSIEVSESDAPDWLRIFGGARDVNTITDRLGMAGLKWRKV